MTKKKYPQNLHTSKIFIFLKTPNKIETPKNSLSLCTMHVYMKISEYPPCGHAQSHCIVTQRSR